MLSHPGHIGEEHLRRGRSADAAAGVGRSCALGERPELRIDHPVCGVEQALVLPRVAEVALHRAVPGPLVTLVCRQRRARRGERIPGITARIRTELTWP